MLGTTCGVPDFRDNSGVDAGHRVPVQVFRCSPAADPMFLSSGFRGAENVVGAMPFSNFPHQAPPIYVPAVMNVPRNSDAQGAKGAGAEASEVERSMS